MFALRKAAEVWAARRYELPASVCEAWFKANKDGDSETALPMLCAIAGARDKPLTAAAECGDAVVERVVADLRSRSATGQAKYGRTLDRSDLTPAQWREHLYQELLDAVNYLAAERRREEEAARG